MTGAKNSGGKEHGLMPEDIRQRDHKDETVIELSDLFKMLSDSTRLRMLLAMEDGEVSVCALSDRLGMSVSAVSHQLKTLKQAHLVKSRRAGKNIYYSLDDHHVKTLLDIALEHMEEDQ